MKKFHEMSFSEFAGSVKPTGAVNRLPQIGTGNEVLSYSVYMNGPAAEGLPADAQEHTYPDMVVHTLTEKLGLNIDSFRDNIKVAELLAVRSAWMAAISSASLERDDSGKVVILSDEVVRDYDALTSVKGMTHPWLNEQVVQQRAVSQKLRPALQAAEQVSQKPLVERVPSAVSHGVILSQNPEFTVQAIGNDQVVAHENSKLESVPTVGQHVTVAYYRGNGQVFENTNELEMSPPYVHEKFRDLAINVTNRETGNAQVVLFHNLHGFEQFVLAQHLDPKMVQQAKDAQEMAAQRTEIVTAKTQIVSPLTIDTRTGAFCVDVESGIKKHTLLFSSVDQVLAFAIREDVDMEIVRQAAKIEDKGIALKAAKDLVGDDVVMVDLQRGVYRGRVVAETMAHSVQNLGRRTSAIHDKDNLNFVPSVGHQAEVKYQDGRATVTSQDRSQVQVQGRGGR